MTRIAKPVKLTDKQQIVLTQDELKDKILSFVTYFNETMAKAFKWTYKGRILKV